MGAHREPGALPPGPPVDDEWHRAHDLLQDTLTQMFVKWDRVDLDREPDAYARTMMYHLFVSHRRRRSAQELVSDELPELIARDADAALRVDLARALSELGPSQRAVIVARYVDDMSVADVALLVGRSEAWVRQTASRTLSRRRTSPLLTPAFQE
ncbi:hypothetical protein GCM10025789_22160 [Tessaracoccus lubricantis]|uniref:RNA polymerase sigma factor 70 region 4 type 2 domain-containing protein n=1 Tax=Tessaracoccus lubricantis TaxID=545543 RepID=A0ABP9FIS4_9ACTN